MTKVNCLTLVQEDRQREEETRKRKQRDHVAWLNKCLQSAGMAYVASKRACEAAYANSAIHDHVECPHRDLEKKFLEAAEKLFDAWTTKEAGPEEPAHGG